jgi:hypothetical protein
MNRAHIDLRAGTYGSLNYSAFLLVVLFALGGSAQTCNVNSLSRCDSKFRIISSKDLPAGGLEGLKTQAHCEQPQPRKRCCSIHTSFRLMAALVAAPHRCLTPCLVPAGGLHMRDETCSSQLGATFAPAYCLIAQKPSPSLAAGCAKRLTKFTCASVNVCSISYIRRRFVLVRTPISGLV